VIVLLSNEEREYQTLTTLGKIEANTRNILETQTKHIYVLLAIICAIVGVEFIPHSPIDFVQALPHSLGFLGITGGVYAILYKWNPFKRKT